MVSPTGSRSKDADGADVAEPSPEDRSEAAGDIPSSPDFRYDRLNMEVSGAEEGDPVLLLHGWGSSAENMRIIAEGLAGTHHIYNIDLPGHGRSPLPPHAMGVPQHARLVYDLIRHEIDRPVTLVGHSNGGRIALYMASDAEMKPLIRRLVLISPSGIAPHRPASFYLKKYTAKTLKAPFEILPQPLRDFGLDWLRHSLLWKLLSSSDYKALDGVMRETFVRVVTHHLDDRVDRIDVPTLLMWGDRDTAISLRQMNILEQKIRGAGLVVLEGAGHYSYLDEYDTFIAATRHFLDVT